MLVNRDPPPIVPSEYDGFAFMQRCIAIVCRDLRLHNMRENGDVSEQLYMLGAIAHERTRKPKSLRHATT